MSTAMAVYLGGAGVWIFWLSAAWGARVLRGGVPIEILVMVGTVVWPLAMLASCGHALGRAMHRRRERIEAARIERRRILDTPVEQLGDGGGDR